MPKVKTKGGKVRHYPYTPAGYRAAEKAKGKAKRGKGKK